MTNVGQDATRAVDVLQAATAALVSGRQFIERYLGFTATKEGIFMLNPRTEFETLQYIGSMLMQDVGVIQRQLTGDKADVEQMVGGWIKFLAFHHPNGLGILKAHIHTTDETVSALRVQHDAAHAAAVARATAAKTAAPAGTAFVPPRFLPGATHYFDLPSLIAGFEGYEAGVPLLATAVNLAIVEAVAMRIALDNWKHSQQTYDPDVPVAQACTINALVQLLKEARAIVNSVVGPGALKQLALKHVVSVTHETKVDFPSGPGLGATDGYATAGDASKNKASGGGKKLGKDVVGDHHAKGENHARNVKARQARKDNKANAKAKAAKKEN